MRRCLDGRAAEAAKIKEALTEHISRALQRQPSAIAAALDEKDTLLNVGVTSVIAAGLRSTVFKKVSATLVNQSPLSLKLTRFFGRIYRSFKQK